LDTFDVRLLLGVFLASGYLTKRKGPCKDHVEATLNGGIKDTAFLEEKITEIRQSVPTRATIQPYQTPKRESGNRTTVLRFRFKSPSLKLIYNLLYPDGEREITRAALSLLGGRAAAWLWAEGCLPQRNGSAILSHVGRFNDEAALISGWLELLTGASSCITHSWRHPRLVFEPGDVELVFAALHPYAPQTREHLFRPWPQGVD
jgi:hypothetical protein